MKNLSKEQIKQKDLERSYLADHEYASFESDKKNKIKKFFFQPSQYFYTAIEILHPYVEEPMNCTAPSSGFPQTGVPSECLEITTATPEPEPTGEPTTTTSGAMEPEPTGEPISTTSGAVGRHYFNWGVAVFLIIAAKYI